LGKGVGTDMRPSLGKLGDHRSCNQGVIMAKAAPTNQRQPELEPFLYASVGEDWNGNDVTVLSALARLDLDPWEEAADLAKLQHDEALARLGTLLARFRDVPSLKSAHAEVARDLNKLLP
jgi:hypothetical protein